MDEASIETLTEKWLAKNPEVERGDRFGRLTVAGPVFYTRERTETGDWVRQRNAVCRCECGEHLAVTVYQLLSTHVRSCDCCQADEARRETKKHETAGDWL